MKSPSAKSVWSGPIHARSRKTQSLTFFSELSFQHPQSGLQSKALGLGLLVGRRRLYTSASLASDEMGKRGKVQTALEYTVTRVILGGLGLLPRSLAIATGKGLGRIGYGLSNRLRTTGF